MITIHEYWMDTDIDSYTVYSLEYREPEDFENYNRIQIFNLYHAVECLDFVNAQNGEEIFQALYNLTLSGDLEIFSL